VFSDLGIRTKIAFAAALTTVCLLSILGALGYRAMVDATRQSQIELLNERIDEVERQLETDGGLTSRIRVDSSIKIVRRGADIPPPIANTLQVVRVNEGDEVRVIVGLADTKRIDDTFATIRLALWISVLVTGLLVGLTSWMVVGRALAPVRRLTKQAEANMASRSMEPVDADAGHGEISQLATTFNDMLSRLRSADDERRQFVSDASHELRTPLMVLGADAEYALEHDADSVELASRVLTQTERLASLVDDLLMLAALDETSAEPIDTAIVADVISNADAKPLLDRPLEAGGGIAIPDVSRALGNIVANARRHAKEHVKVAVEHRADFVRFVVDDDGPGIPPSERDHVFKRFYRPDHDRNREGGGAGLGLAIARTEVLQAGGAIRVAGSPLGGARFVLDVPTQAGG